MEKIDIELTFKKKEVKAILRLLTKIAECEPEGINRGALELTIQQIEELLDRMKSNSRNVATVALEATKSDFEQIQSLFEGLADSDSGPEDIHDIHEILADDSDEKSLEPAKEDTSSKKEPELPKAPVYKPEPAKVSVKKEVAKEPAGFNCIPGTEMEIRPSRFLRYLK